MAAKNSGRTGNGNGAARPTSSDGGKGVFVTKGLNGKLKAVEYDKPEAKTSRDRSKDN